MKPGNAFVVIICLLCAALDAGSWFFGRPNSGWWIAASIVDILLLLFIAVAFGVMG